MVGRIYCHSFSPFNIFEETPGVVNTRETPQFLDMKHLNAKHAWNPQFIKIIESQFSLHF